MLRPSWGRRLRLSGRCRRPSGIPWLRLRTMRRPSWDKCQPWRTRLSWGSWRRCRLSRSRPRLDSLRSTPQGSMRPSWLRRKNSSRMARRARRPRHRHKWPAPLPSGQPPTNKPTRRCAFSYSLPHVCTQVASKLFWPPEFPTAGLAIETRDRELVFPRVPEGPRQRLSQHGQGRN